MSQWPIKLVKVLPTAIKASEHIGAGNIMSALPDASCNALERKLD
jgi:hypothetical protein